MCLTVHTTTTAHHSLLQKQLEHHTAITIMKSWNHKFLLEALNFMQDGRLKHTQFISTQTFRQLMVWVNLLKLFQQQVMQDIIMEQHIHLINNGCQWLLCLTQICGITSTNHSWQDMVIFGMVGIFLLKMAQLRLLMALTELTLKTLVQHQSLIIQCI